MVARSLQALLLLLAAPAAVHAAIDPLTIGSACCGAAALTAAASLKIVTTGNTCLIERMGRFHRQLDPGWHWTIPILETTSMYGTVREQVMDVPPQQCYTRDKYVTSPHHAAPRRSTPRPAAGCIVAHAGTCRRRLEASAPFSPPIPNCPRAALKRARPG